MRIVMLPGDTGACGYYRVFAPMAALKRAGLAEETFHPPKAPDGQIYVKPRDLAKFDVAVFQRQPEARIGVLITTLQSLGVRCVFDVDDDMFSVPPESTAYKFWGRNKSAGAVDVQRARENLEGMVNNLIKADIATVSTLRLKQVYSNFRKDIIVLPNQIEHRDWDDAVASKFQKIEGQIWVGWSGSQTHAGDLKLIAGPTCDAIREHADARLVIVGFPGASELFAPLAESEQLIVFDWMQLEKYRRVVAAFDIALAPSDDIEFNHGKSDLRVLEAAVCGVPVVASEMTYGETVREARCGLVARSPKKWRQHVEALIRNAGLRREMGQAGRDYVLLRRTYDANAIAWYKAYGGRLES